MRSQHLRTLLLTVVVSPALLGATISAQEKSTEAPPATATEQPAEDSQKESAAWKKLIVDEELKGWEKTNFGGEGDVRFKEGVLKLGFGNPLTGVHTKNKDLPKDRYEMRWKARRVDGADFFAGVTFPVGDEFCSFICGGWGGGLVGISSINGNDASENQTSSFHSFKNGEWYSFRIQVETGTLKVWIDEKEVVNVDREGKKFTVRPEVRESRPLGYCVFQCVTEVKDWEIRSLD